MNDAQRQLALAAAVAALLETGRYTLTATLISDVLDIQRLARLLRQHHLTARIEIRPTPDGQEELTVILMSKE